MIEKIFEDIFRIEIPLPGNPLKSINSYVIKHSDRNLIIDTGMNRKACKEAMAAGLSELNVDLEKTDFFITHMHADHFALVSILATENSIIYFNQADAEIIMNAGRWDKMVSFAGSNGFPEDELMAALSNHPANKYGSKFDRELKILKEGDTISVGDYLLKCIETPGHTKGHMCLYEGDKKILFSGDHILGDITPNIQLWTDDYNPLQNYLLSLDKVDELDVEVVLPGHRRIFRTFRERINELKHHHHKRAEEIISILKKESRNAYGVASQMTWDIDCESWEQFPVSQKWFATGETIAHLKYIKEKGEINSEKVKNEVIYSVNNK